MMARFILVPDPTDPPQPCHVELFANCPDICTVAQVAEALGVCKQTVRNLIASGELRSVHIGRAVRVTKQAMVEFVTAQEMIV